MSVMDGNRKSQRMFRELEEGLREWEDVPPARQGPVTRPGALCCLDGLDGGQRLTQTLQHRDARGTVLNRPLIWSGFPHQACPTPPTLPQRETEHNTEVP